MDMRSIQMSLSLKFVDMKRYSRHTKRRIYRVKERSIFTFEIVPPITNKIFLVEYGTIGTEE